MLEVEKIRKVYGDTSALRELSFVVEKGETQVLLGSSGSGKSTALKIILGLIPADSGTIRVQGHRLEAEDLTAWVKRFGYMPQASTLFPHQSVRENITLSARLARWESARIEARLAYLRERIPLEKALLDRFPATLSGGQRQRVALLRAAFLDPEILLLDEPLGALDPLLRFELQIELRQLFRNLGKTVVLVTHDLAEAKLLGHRVALLHQGMLVQNGTFSDLVHRPRTAFVRRFLDAQRRWDDFPREDFA